MTGVAGAGAGSQTGSQTGPQTASQTGREATGCAPALFYHLTHSPREGVAAMLLTRALAQGWRVELRGNLAAGPLAQIDERLWRGGPTDFLPHGIAGGDHDALQPVLITNGAPDAEAGRFDAVMAVAGAPVSKADCEGRQRLWILFDGQDEAALSTARAQWKTLAEQGVEGQYWSEAEGSWKRMR